MKQTILFILATLLLASSCQRPETVSEPKPQNEIREIKVSGANVKAAEPAIAADAAGNVYLTYVDHTNKDGSDVYLQKLKSDGTPTGERVRVNPEAGQAKAWYGDPPTIRTGDGGKVFVGWTAKYGEKGTTLYLSASSDSGATFGPPVKVNDDAGETSHGMHSLAVGPDGKIHMAWLDERNIKHTEHAAKVEPKPEFEYIKAFHHEDARTKPAPKRPHETGAEPNSESYFAVSTDGGKTFSPNKKLASEVCPCCKTSVEVAPDGALYVAWRQVLDNGTRHIAITSSRDAGATFEAPTIVSDDKWQISACPVSGAALMANSGGAVEVAWYTAGEMGQPGLYMARSDNGGKTFSPRLMVSNEASGGTPDIVNGARTGYTIFSSLNTVQIKPIDGAITKIADAANPSAAISANNLLVASVRETGESKSVCVASMAVQ